MKRILLSSVAVFAFAAVAHADELSDIQAQSKQLREQNQALTKRLAVSAEGGDPTVVASEHRDLVRWIDRAVSRGALHRNAGARKKSQAARPASPPPPA